MATTSQFTKRMNDYKKCMRILNCANHVYLDEIENFEYHNYSIEFYEILENSYYYELVKKQE